MTKAIALDDLLTTADPSVLEVTTAGAGPQGRLPLTAEMLLEQPSGDIFGLTQNAGMGWAPHELLRPQFLMLSTHGGIRAPDGTPIALGYHTGHWEIGLLMQAAADELRAARAACRSPAFVLRSVRRPHPGHGRHDGQPRLPQRRRPWCFRRLIRSLPTRRGVLGVATCDKGLPAMMMALAAMRDLPCVLVPGGVTLPPRDGEDAGKVQSIGARFAHGELTLDQAADLGCRACGSPGGGCQFLGTAATSQVVGEALGLSLPHSALAPSGQPIWLDMARRSARALVSLSRRGLAVRDIVTDAAVRNAMAVHAAFGGSTNLLLHIPAIAHAAGLRRPTVEDWMEVNRRVPRLVDALPNGPRTHRPCAFPGRRRARGHAAPAAPRVARRASASPWPASRSAACSTGGKAASAGARCASGCARPTGSNPTTSSWTLTGRGPRGLTSTVTFPRGNLAPEGSVIKSTAIDPSVVDADGVYRKTGPARVFTREKAAIAAIKNRGPEGLKAGDVLVLICRGPLGAGMEEIYQITAALKHLSWGKHVAVVTDARFSGVSTGACIGHVGPEALAGGPIGRAARRRPHPHRRRSQPAGGHGRPGRRR